MSDAVQQIKQRLSIVDVVSSYVKLQKAGKNYKAKSPFTNEKTPSFFVSPERDMYYCFSSGKGGDIFTFVQEMEGLDFRGALAVLAERAGVELAPYRRQEKDERDRLFHLMDEAATHYAHALERHPDVRAYLAERGLTPETTALWRVGYAPAGWRNLHEAFRRRGTSSPELERAGLIKRPDDEPASGKGTEKYYDRFRGRIMFPIMDSAGRVIAFSGRIFPHADNPEYKDDAAKYLNSPETPLYNKSHALYGYHRAKHAIRKFDFAIAVEGQMDLLMSHQAGYTNTVAVSGSALSDAQLTLLRRLSDNLVLAFDADTSGVTSAGRTAELALSRGMNVKVASLPSGVDPADLVREGKDRWRAAVREAQHIIDFYLGHLERTIADVRKRRLAVGRVVLPYVAMIPNRIDQAHFVSSIAARLGIGEEPVWHELRKAIRERADANTEIAETKPAAATPEPSVTPTERRLAGIIVWQRELEGRDLDTKELEKRVREVVGESRLKELLRAGERNRARLLFEVESMYEDAHALAADVEELLVNLKRGRLVEDRNAVLHALRQAELEHDTSQVESLTKKYVKLTDELEALTLSTAP